ncbi:MAG TPA: TonB-dependent receptor [Candidatus Acidoferrales bacterium]|jgi:TonB-dependent receptor|nr:TonB-dependent receptor [Candidatus Acidoferrales bacterium]
MRKCIYSIILLVLFSCTTLGLRPAAAQEAKGSIAGTVKDSANAVLTGALVELQPIGNRAVSDDQGQFRMADVPAGEYTLTVSYVGLSPFTSTVKVAPGQAASVDAILKIAGVTEQVVVSAERVVGEAEAINIERTNDDIVQVLPLKVINSLPNTNIADAVGRVPSVSLERDEGEGKYVQIRGTEPRLTNVTINGVNVPAPEGIVRQIKLDSVPADLVERIEVFKTLSANQDADGIGGTVNLVTKVATDIPTYSLGGSGGYNPIQGGRTLGEFDGTAGHRFGAGNKFGVILGGTWDRNNRGINDLEPTQGVGSGPSGNNVAVVSSEDERSYSYYRTRYGFDSGVDYNITPSTSVYLKGFYSDFHDYGDVWVYTPNSGNTIKSVNGSQITFDNAQDCVAVNQAADLSNPGSNPCSPGFYQYRHYIRRPDQQVFSILTGLRADLSSWLVVVEAAGSRGHNIGGQDFPTTNFVAPTAAYDKAGNLVPGSNGADLAVTLADPLRPKFVALDNSNLYDPTQYALSQTEFTNYIATQVNYQGAVSVARRYTAHSHSGTFEFGLKIRDSSSYQHENDQFYVPSGASPFTLSQVLGTASNPTYYDGFFKIGTQGYGPESDYNKIIQMVVPNLGSGLVLDPVQSTTRSAGAFFNADERVYAGYLMNAISIGKWRFNTGVRLEGTSTNFLANQLTANVDASGNALPPTVTPVTQSSSYLNAVPELQAQYLIQKDTNIRANFSMAISRPNIGDLVPTTVVDPNASPKSVTLGNPNLKPTRSNNYDLMVEHFFQPLGILQAGFYYKQLSNPIYPTSVVLTAGPNAGFLQSQSINGPDAYLYGVELDWEQRFSFLPGLANGFGVAANYSYTTSQATFPAGFSGGRTDHPLLQRDAPNTWNVNLTYDKSRYSVRFAVSHNDANIAAYSFQQNSTPNDPILGLKGPTGDQYFYAHTQLDIQGSIRMYKGLSFFAYGLNLTNEVFGLYQGSPIYPIQREFYKPTVAFGMRWNFAPEGANP